MYPTRTRPSGWQATTRTGSLNWPVKKSLTMVSRLYRCSQSRAELHDGQEQTLQSMAGYIDARPLTASSAKPLATHGRTIHLGQKAKYRTQTAMSALTLTPDERPIIAQGVSKRT